MSLPCIHFSGTPAQLAASVCAESSGGPQPAEGIRVHFVFTGKSRPGPSLAPTRGGGLQHHPAAVFQDLLEKLKEAEESHGTLQAECEQYRTVLAETVTALSEGPFGATLPSVCPLQGTGGYVSHHHRCEYY